MTVKTKRYKRWTEEEIAYIEYNYGVMTTAELAEELGRNAQAIRSAAYSRGMKRKGQLEYTIYSGEEIKFTGNQEDCAAYLDVSIVDFHSMKAPSYAERSKNGIRIVDLGRWRIDEDE